MGPALSPERPAPCPAGPWQLPPLQCPWGQLNLPASRGPERGWPSAAPHATDDPTRLTLNRRRGRLRRPTQPPAPHPTTRTPQAPWPRPVSSVLRSGGRFRRGMAATSGDPRTGGSETRGPRPCSQRHLQTPLTEGQRAAAPGPGTRPPEQSGPEQRPLPAPGGSGARWPFQPGGKSGAAAVKPPPGGWCHPRWNRGRRATSSGH